ncbi:MAG: hypothetical protein ACLVB1_04760 [Blautia obeum]
MCRQDEERGEYLHLRSQVLQIQNLLENMIYSLVTGKGDQNRINQTTMGLIFLYLLESVQYAEMRLPNQYEHDHNDNAGLYRTAVQNGGTYRTLRKLHLRCIC